MSDQDTKHSIESAREEIRFKFVRRARNYCSIGGANDRARRYVDSLTDEDIKKYLEDKRKKRIAEINSQLEKNRNNILKLEEELERLS